MKSVEASLHLSEHQRKKKMVTDPEFRFHIWVSWLPVNVTYRDKKALAVAMVNVFIFPPVSSSFSEHLSFLEFFLLISSYLN